MIVFTTLTVLQFLSTVAGDQYVIRGNVDCWINERSYPTYDIAASFRNADVCAEACLNNATCIGFSVKSEKCTYKSDKCENVIGGMTGTTIWLKKGGQYRTQEKAEVLYSLKSDGTSGHYNCWGWCNSNIICTGFYFLTSTCHFVSGNDVECDHFFRKKVIHIYEKRERHDCKTRTDIHSMGSDQTSNHISCQQWCNNNWNCVGFAVSHNRCYFKRFDCVDGVYERHNIDLFLKQAQHAYQRQYFRDCTADDDLYSESTDGTFYNNNCMERCNNDPECGAFVLYNKLCYFKNNDCKNHLQNGNGALYLKQG